MKLIPGSAHSILQYQKLDSTFSRNTCFHNSNHALTSVHWRPTRRYDMNHMHARNSTPQSTRFCRPMWLCYEYENVSTINAELQRLKKEVQEVFLHIFVLANGKSVSVQYKTDFTMLNGMALNAVLDNASKQSCLICKLKMPEFNPKRFWHHTKSRQRNNRV